MKKWNVIERAITPDGKNITLVEHDGSYSIRVDHLELMSTRQHGSEERLAEVGCAHLRDKPDAAVLIGGLGFGFTLQAALAILAPHATVVVAEILGAIIEWNRKPELPMSAVIADPRVTIRHSDVLDVIRKQPHGFDSILLDVDNGPLAMTAEGNTRLYSAGGLQLARAALRANGCVAFWSAAPDAAFEKLMTDAGFAVDVHHCRARGNTGRRHTIFLGSVGPDHGLY